MTGHSGFTNMPNKVFSYSFFSNISYLHVRSLLSDHNIFFWFSLLLFFFFISSLKQTFSLAFASLDFCSWSLLLKHLILFIMMLCYYLYLQVVREMANSAVASYFPYSESRYWSNPTGYCNVSHLPVSPSSTQVLTPH